MQPCKHVEGEHLPAITETEAEESDSKKSMDNAALPVSPFADSPADKAAVPSGDAAGAIEAGNGAAAARVLSAAGRAATADAHLTPALSGGVAALGSHGSVALAPVASGLGSQRLMSVRLTANSGLVYNSTPIPTLLPPGGGWPRCRHVAC